MSQMGNPEAPIKEGVPRASGDEPSGRVVEYPYQVCSPRERG